MADQWDPWSTVDHMHREMERLLDHFQRSKSSPISFAPHHWHPAVDVIETEQEVVIVAELAGVAEEEVEVSVEEQELVLRGERKDPLQGSSLRYHCMEISCGPFERRVPLPQGTDPDGAQATFKDGFLEIVLPKKPQAQPHRVQIKIP